MESQKYLRHFKEFGFYFLFSLLIFAIPGTLFIVNNDDKKSLETYVVNTANKPHFELRIRPEGSTPSDPNDPNDPVRSNQISDFSTDDVFILEYWLYPNSQAINTVITGLLLPDDGKFEFGRSELISSEIDDTDILPVSEGSTGKIVTIAKNGGAWYFGSDPNKSIEVFEIKVKAKGSSYANNTPNIVTTDSELDLVSVCDYDTSTATSDCESPSNLKDQSLAQGKDNIDFVNDNGGGNGEGDGDTKNIEYRIKITGILDDYNFNTKNLTFTFPVSFYDQATSGSDSENISFDSEGKSDSAFDFTSGHAYSFTLSAAAPFVNYNALQFDTTYDEGGLQIVKVIPSTQGNGPVAIDFGEVCLGDLDGDGIINAVDVGKLLDKNIFGHTNISFENGNLNKDGIVNTFDWAIINRCHKDSTQN